MDITSLYNDLYSKEAGNAKNKQLANSVKNRDFSNASDEELMGVCKQFESYFVEQVLKQSMSVFTEGEQTDSGAMATLTSYYKDNLMTEYAGKITEREDLGLAKILYEQMKRNISPNVKPVEEVKAEAANADTNETEKASTISAEEAISTTMK